MQQLFWAFSLHRGNKPCQNPLCNGNDSWVRLLIQTFADWSQSQRSRWSWRSRRQNMGILAVSGCRTSEVTLVLENLVFFSVSQTTHTQRATSVPSGWISRSGLWTWIPKPWNYRFGTRLGRTNPRHRVQILSKFRVFACFGKMILK